jgi:hypothetical protein
VELGVELSGGVFLRHAGVPAFKLEKKINK